MTDSRSQPGNADVSDGTAELLALADRLALLPEFDGASLRSKLTFDDKNYSGRVILVTTKSRDAIVAALRAAPDRKHHRGCDRARLTSSLIGGSAMSEIRPVGAWTVWHPTLEWGTPVPMLWASKHIAEEVVKARGLWPLRHGWQMIRVTVTPSIPSTEHS